MKTEEKEYLKTNALQFMANVSLLLKMMIVDLKC